LRQDRAQAQTIWDSARLRVDALQGAAPPPVPPDAPSAPESVLRERLQQAQQTLEAAHQRFAIADAERRELETLQREGVCPRCHQPVRADEFRDHLAEVTRATTESREAVQAATAGREERERAVRAREDAERVEERRAHHAALTTDALAQEAAARGRAEVLDQRIEETARTLAVTEQTLENLHDAPHRAELLSERLATLEREVRVVDERQTELSNELVELRTQLGARGTLLADIAHARGEAARRSAESPVIQARRDEIERALRLLEVEVARLPELLVSRRRAGEQRAALDHRIGGLEGQLTRAGEARAIAVADTGRREHLLQEAAEERSVARWFVGEFRESIATLEQRLLTRAQQEFQIAFARFFRALVDDPAMQARCDGTFSPAVEIDGEWTPPEALSGGERTALALAFRLALGLVVRDVGRLRLETLILDEPTDGFSPEQVTRMGDLLESLGIGQVILVSHEGLLAAAADRVVQVRKEDGVSVLREADSAGATAEGDAHPRPVATPTPRARRVRTPKLDTPPAS
jgi:DNA repair protein SbcC/Rad50